MILSACRKLKMCATGVADAIMMMGLIFIMTLIFPCPRIAVLTICLDTFLSIDNPASGIIDVYHLESCFVLKEGMGNTPFSEYFLCIGRVNRVQVDILDAGN